MLTGRSGTGMAMFLSKVSKFVSIYIHLGMQIRERTCEVSSICGNETGTELSAGPMN